MIKEALDIFLSTIEGQFTIRLIICIILGFFIGNERKRRGKNAGVSTFTLVLTGAMVFTFLGTLIADQDHGRIAAGIVTGIGFLGAGIIMKDGQNIINLTTAAGIWFAGAIGMSIGMGFYWIAIMSSCVMMMSGSGSDTFMKSENSISGKVKNKISNMIKKPKRKSEDIDEETSV